MFDQLAHSSTAFWLLALLIAAVDSLVILQPGQFTYSFWSGLKIKLRASAYPYLLLGREPIISLISYPATPFFLCSIGAPTKPRSQTKLVLLAAKRLTRDCAPLSVFAIATFVLFVVLGPILASQWGSGRTIVVIWAISYAFTASAMVYLWICRHRFGLTRQRTLLIGLELAFCPFLMVNVVKKVTWQKIEQLNANDLIQSFADNPKKTLTDLRSNLAEQSTPEAGHED